VRTGHVFPLRSANRDAPLRAKARAAAEEVGLGHRLGALVGELSHGERRQLAIGMARAAEPRLMMLDEPAAGLSRAERQTLTGLLLALPADVTLLLIEHDMDVALRVADWVTMMHDGRVVAEGTPAQIRANETVHELYLGSRYYDE
jgi:branched-chain amino acid transport system ATP-binding protein